MCKNLRCIVTGIIGNEWKQVKHCVTKQVAPVVRAIPGSTTLHYSCGRSMFYIIMFYSTYLQDRRSVANVLCDYFAPDKSQLLEDSYILCTFTRSYPICICATCEVKGCIMPKTSSKFNIRINLITLLSWTCLLYEHWAGHIQNKRDEFYIKYILLMLATVNLYYMGILLLVTSVFFSIIIYISASFETGGMNLRSNRMYYCHRK